MADGKGLALSRAYALNVPVSDWKKVKEVFHEALRLDSGERDLFLTEACAGDLNLRLEVESLLISLTEAKSFLEQPLIGEPPKTIDEWQLEPGRLISHYKIVSPIGTGGMGEVYLAEDQQLLRQVALKILPEHLMAIGDRVRRFQREANAVSGLNHPNILTIFEFGAVDGVYILASEFVKGETLRTRLGRGPLPLEDALDIAVQIASALNAAHEARVIHRDIKPENVMIREDGYVKVLDFGLAKLSATGSDPDAETRPLVFSQPGMILGTASYMSPEQARAKSLDARSDIFSLGVVLYEMLSGRKPFEGESTSDVIASIIQSDPPPVSRFNTAVPGEVDRIIEKCLEKDRDERYQTAAHLLVDLKHAKKAAEGVASRSEEETEILQSDRATKLVAERPTADERSLPATPRRSTYVIVALIAVAIIAAVGAAYWFLGGN
jgi:serine/threonine protein kinase